MGPVCRHTEEEQGWAQSGSRSGQPSSMALGGDKLEKGGEEPGNWAAKANVKKCRKRSRGNQKSREVIPWHGGKMRLREELCHPKSEGKERGRTQSGVYYSPFSIKILLFPGQRLQTAAQACWGTSPTRARDWSQHGFNLPWISALNQAVTPHPDRSGASPQEQKVL